MARPSAVHRNALSIDTVGANSKIFTGRPPSGGKTPMCQTGLAPASLYQQAMAPSRSDTVGRMQISWDISTGSPPAIDVFQMWKPPPPAGRWKITQRPSAEACGLPRGGFASRVAGGGSEAKAAWLAEA